MRPVIGFTMGDPAGIGPEVLVRALNDRLLRRVCVPLAIGSKDVLRRHGWRPGLSLILDPGVGCPAAPGRPTPEGARASFAAVRLAEALASRGRLGGMVTGPISKRSWGAAGIPYRDHTTFLKEKTRAPRAAMMLLAGRFLATFGAGHGSAASHPRDSARSAAPLRTVPLTGHVALKDVARRLDAAALTGVVRLLRAALSGALGVSRPRIGLCALNPHAGEGGLLGSEEADMLSPAVRSLRRSGVAVDGPLPADAAWRGHWDGRYDALVTLYHDQALIPLKMADPYGVVNWTIGLPIVRTAPGHGTAFDIAGRGRADPLATLRAALLAARLASRPRPWP